MNYDALFAQYADRTVRAGLIGAGQFGASFIAQTIRTPILDVPLLCDLDAERAASARRRAGNLRDMMTARCQSNVELASTHHHAVACPRSMRAPAAEAAALSEGDA